MLATLAAGSAVLTAEQSYQLDVSGFFVLPSLYPDGAPDTAALPHDPTLLRYLDELMGGVGHRLDMPPRPLQSTPSHERTGGVALQGGCADRARRLRYESAPAPGTRAGFTRVSHTLAAVSRSVGCGGSATTLPLPCCSTAFVAKTAAFLAVPQVPAPVEPDQLWVRAQAG